MSGQGSARFFSVIHIDVLRRQFDLRKQSLDMLHDNYSIIANEFATMQGALVHTPSVQISQ
jgi:hypothetical protein